MWYPHSVKYFDASRYVIVERLIITYSSWADRSNLPTMCMGRTTSPEQRTLSDPLPLTSVIKCADAASKSLCTTHLRHCAAVTPTHPTWLQRTRCYSCDLVLVLSCSLDFVSSIWPCRAVFEGLSLSHPLLSPPNSLANIVQRNIRISSRHICWAVDHIKLARPRG